MQPRRVGEEITLAVLVTVVQIVLRKRRAPTLLMQMFLRGNQFLAKIKAECGGLA